MPIRITETVNSYQAPTSPGVSEQPEMLQWSTSPRENELPLAGPGNGMPPVVLPPGVANDPRRRRHRWSAALVGLAVVAALAIGVGVGSSLGATRTGSSSTLVIGASRAPSIADSTSTLSLQQSLENVAKAVEPSVVKVTSVSLEQEAVGSGDILTANGYIVTNDHVVAGYTSYSVTLTSGAKYSAALVGQDSQDDLAVLKIAASNLTPVAFADSSKAQVGEFAVAIGYPLGLQETATSGIVSALNRTVSEAPSGPAGELPGLVQTSAELNPGNSGGALVNIQGQVIGIPTLSATDSETGSTANAIGYAIPSDRVTYVASQLISYGKLTSSEQGFLGIQGADVTPQVASAYGLSVDSGVLVTGFANDAAGQSPAEQAGLQSGDIITAVNGQSVTNSDDLSAATLGQLPGTRVMLTLTRGGSHLTVNVTLGQRSAQ